MQSEFVTNSTYRTNHASPLKFILSHIRRHPLIALVLVLGASSNALGAAAVPYFTGLAFNAIIEDNDLDRVRTMVIAIIVSQLVRSVLQWSRNYSAESYGQLIERDVRDELYASLLGKSMSYHDFQPVGEIMARVTNDVREMNLMMNPGVNLILGSSMFMLMPVILSPTLHPALIIPPGLFVIVYFYAQYRFVRTLHPIAEQVRSSFGVMNANLAETLEGLQVVKGAAQEEREMRRFSKLADEVRDQFIRQGSVEARYLPLLLWGITTVGGFALAIFLFQNGSIRSGDIITFMGLIALFGFPVFVSLVAFSQIASGYASAGRILEVIKAQTDLDRNEAGLIATVSGAINFRHVNFGYGDGKQVLYDVSFDVEAGQTVALVGQTGSGKSTVTKLINRIYDVDSGEVLVDGVNVKDWNLESLRSQISIIEQDIFLFSRSIADNIRFGKQDATREEIIDAAKKAQAHEFIIGFPDGYDTVIGQRGVTLSGGQRQRLALARAFLTNPPILILDDSTSAIDSATEDRIQRAIWTAARGRTTILITHRLSQIRWADHIIVMQQGRVVAQGKHETLLETTEAYRRIFARYDAPTHVNTNGAHHLSVQSNVVGGGQ
ncbi:MAG: ABC transporter ATP-binding protein [Chloroflexi bacterium]|nr:MAG: ABC transporter ATP-binding protein [Phototrophicales bacterium]RMF81820.1 MAG: ABC transporter ATP-binding protein [Chloroflexota bacterium]